MNKWGKLDEEFRTRMNALCLDSKYEGGKLNRQACRVMAVLCPDSKYEGGKLHGCVG